MDVQQTVAASPLKKTGKSASFPLLPLILIGCSVCCYLFGTLVSHVLNFTVYGITGIQLLKNLFISCLYITGFAGVVLGLFLHKKNGSLFMGIGFAMFSLVAMITFGQNALSFLQYMRFFGFSAFLENAFSLLLVCVEVVAFLAIAASLILHKNNVFRIVRFAGCGALVLVQFISIFSTTIRYLKYLSYTPGAVIVTVLLLWFTLVCVTLPKVAAVVLYKPYVAEATEPIEVAEAVEQ